VQQRQQLSAKRKFSTQELIAFANAASSISQAQIKLSNQLPDSATAHAHAQAQAQKRVSMIQLSNQLRDSSTAHTHMQVQQRVAAAAPVPVPVLPPLLSSRAIAVSAASSSQTMLTRSSVCST
jgi:hypothetical protein